MNFFTKTSILLIIFIISSVNLNTRELSIKDLEERKRIDQERELEREKRGKKEFSKEILFTTEIVFFTKERKIPPVLSNLDPILDDEGFYGIKLGNEDNLTTGRFTGHDYKVKYVQVSLEENLISEFKKLVEKGYKYFIVDLKKNELLQIQKTVTISEILIFNIRSPSDSLRGKNCHTSIFHVPPSYAMLADSLTQYLVKKKWKDWFLVVGADEKDKEFANALKKSASKFKIKIKEERIWDFASDLRRTAQKEVPVFTKGVKYDVLVVSDINGVFGEYLSYRTWNPRPVVGTQGLVPTNWHRTHEQWGATQMQNRFRRESQRWMTPTDYSAWVAIRSIGEAVTRVGKNNVKDIKNYLITNNFGIGAYKGVKVSYRKWNRQLRQPVLLAASRSMVSISPQEGYLHPISELDTLGIDDSESTCKFN